MDSLIRGAEWAQPGTNGGLEPAAVLSLGNGNGPEGA
jgi:hypothetical protein